jgi:putative transposase
VKQALPTASTRTICRVLGVARSALYRHQPDPTEHDQPTDDAALLARIHELIQLHPTYGYRRIWARLRFGDKRLINRKKVRRLMRQQGWMVRQRPAAPKPRVRRKKSVATRRNARWALDATHIRCGEDGWGHVVAVIDCYDREIVGWEFALRGRANEAERALEMACLARFGTLRPHGEVPIIRSDNGLIFPSRRFRDACRFAPAAASMYYAGYARTTWADRALVSIAEGGMCVAPPIPELCGCAHHHCTVDCVELTRNVPTKR